MRDDDALFVLVHSPLVGPSTWSPVARELERRGRRAVVPSLSRIADAPAPRWRYVCETVAASLPEEGSVVLAGHSGAGLLLPAIAQQLERPVAALLFVDAFLPPAEGAVELMPPELLDELRGLAVEGLLPTWSRWFAQDELAELVPDDTLRAALEREMPRLPVAYFDERPSVPRGWDSGRCAYLLLSDEPYAPAAAEAKQRGWPMTALAGGHHLSLVTDPAAVAVLVLQLEHAVA